MNVNYKFDKSMNTITKTTTTTVTNGGNTSTETTTILDGNNHAETETTTTSGQTTTTTNTAIEDGVNNTDSHSGEVKTGKLLGQLHEQYAINNNANLSNVIALIVAAVAIIAVYGYIYLKSTLEFSPDFNYLYYGNNDIFSFDAVFIVASVTIVILTILSYICICQGLAQRMEQFITYAIRYKSGLVKSPAFLKNSICDDPCDNMTESSKTQNINSGDDYIFPNNYHPFNKAVISCSSSCCIIKKLLRWFICIRAKELNIVQGLYGEFVKIFNILSWFVVFSVLFKVVASIFIVKTWQFGWPMTIEIGFLIFIIFVWIFTIAHTLKKAKSKYCYRSKEYICNSKEFKF